MYHEYGYARLWLSSTVSAASKQRSTYSPNAHEHEAGDDDDVMCLLTHAHQHEAGDDDEGEREELGDGEHVLNLRRPAHVEHVDQRQDGWNTETVALQ